MHHLYSKNLMLLNKLPVVFFLITPECPLPAVWVHRSLILLGNRKQCNQLHPHYPEAFLLWLIPVGGQLHNSPHLKALIRGQNLFLPLFLCHFEEGRQSYYFLLFLLDPVLVSAVTAGLFLYWQSV